MTIILEDPTSFPSWWKACTESVIHACSVGPVCLIAGVCQNFVFVLVNIQECGQGSTELHQLPPGEPLNSCTEKEEEGETEARSAEAHTPTRDSDGSPPPSPAPVSASIPYCALPSLLIMAEL